MFLVCWVYSFPFFIVMTEVFVVLFRHSTQVLGNLDRAISFLIYLCIQDM